MRVLRGMFLVLLCLEAWPGAEAVGQGALPPTPSVLGSLPMGRERCPSHEGESTHQPSEEREATEISHV